MGSNQPSWGVGDKDEVALENAATWFAFCPEYQHPNKIDCGRAQKRERVLYFNAGDTISWFTLATLRCQDDR